MHGRKWICTSECLEWMSESLLCIIFKISEFQKKRHWTLAQNNSFEPWISQTLIMYRSLTWMVTIRGKGCRVLAPPSIAMPRVLAFFTTCTRVALRTGTGEPVCWDTKWKGSAVREGAGLYVVIIATIPSNLSNFLYPELLVSPWTC